MKRIYWRFALLVFAVVAMASCSEDDGAYDRYANWPARNVQYYQTVADSARQAITEAKAQWGDDWEAHCDWRMFKSVSKADVAGPVTDSICVRILARGNAESGSPYWNDTVRLHYVGMLMPTKAYIDGALKSDTTVFDRSYYGAFNPLTAVPAKLPVSGVVMGMGTALVNMHVDDYWRVYIPQKLGYGSELKALIPAYSTLAFTMRMSAFYRAGTVVPEWK